MRRNSWPSRLSKRRRFTNPTSRWCGAIFTAFWLSCCSGCHLPSCSPSAQHRRNTSTTKCSTTQPGSDCPSRVSTTSSTALQIVTFVTLTSISSTIVAAKRPYRRRDVVKPMQHRAPMWESTSSPATTCTHTPVPSGPEITRIGRNVTVMSYDLKQAKSSFNCENIFWCAASCNEIN